MKYWEGHWDIDGYFMVKHGKIPNNIDGKISMDIVDPADFTERDCLSGAALDLIQHRFVAGFGRQQCMARASTW